jgi:hypothetical protein
VIAIGTTLFPFLVFGIIGIHYRLESSVFLFHNVLAWLTLVMTIWLSYLYLSDVRSSLKEETLRLLHRTVLLVTLWILNYIFIALDVIRIVEA